MKNKHLKICDAASNRARHHSKFSRPLFAFGHENRQSASIIHDFPHDKTLLVTTIFLKTVLS